MAKRYQDPKRFQHPMSFVDGEGNKVNPSKKDYNNSATYKSKYDKAHGLNDKYKSLISEYGKDSPEVYKFEKNELGMHRRGKPGKLEGLMGIIGLLGGIFFLSFNMTGNVIANMTNSTSNLIGAVLILVGLTGSFFWFRNSKR